MPPAQTDLDILYEDNHLIIINKPLGGLVHGDKTGDETLEEKLKVFLKVKYNKPGEVFLRAVHRLDRPVTGVLIFGKTSKGHERMAKLFKEHQVDKTYWALTRQLPSRLDGRVEQYLVKNPEKNRVFYYWDEVEGSKKAITNMRMLGQRKGYNLFELKPLTGRSHQLRVLMKSLGSPIAGDLKYGSHLVKVPKAILLHARRIAFIHPVKKEEIVIYAPLPSYPEWQLFPSEDFE